MQEILFFQPRNNGLFNTKSLLNLCSSQLNNNSKDKNYLTIKPIESEKNYLCTLFHSIMRKTANILLFALLLTGCKENIALKYTEKKIEEKTDTECIEYCPAATLKIALFEAGNTTNDSINKKTFEFFVELLSFDEKVSEVNTYEELLTSFMNSYKELHHKFPDETIGWEANGNSILSFHNHKIVCIKLDYYIYTGGAHGYSGTKSIIFDKKNGRTLTLTDIFKDINDFTIFSEQKFKNKFGIKPNAPINSTGLMFENEVFELPENLLFTEKGLTLLYNTYEIASYSDGPQEVTISYEEAQPFLKIF